MLEGSESDTDRPTRRERPSEERKAPNRPELRSQAPDLLKLRVNPPEHTQHGPSPTSLSSLIRHRSPAEVVERLVRARQAW